MNPETALLQKIRLFCSGVPGVVLFRNAIGYDSRAHVDYGIMNPGGPDLVGWVSQYPNSDNPLPVCARFLGIEVKTPTGIVSPDQRLRISLIRKHGGLAGVARSTSDAKEIIDGLIKD